LKKIKENLDKEKKSPELRSRRLEKKPEEGEEEEEVICGVCYCNKPDSVYMPCGHGGICYDCAIDIWKSSDECYLCRKVKGFLTF
jgi:hypothetical protein